MSRQDGGTRKGSATLPHIAWRLEGMIAGIAERRPRASGAIEQALRKVPRHWFVPDQGLALDDHGDATPIDREIDPQTWWDAVYSAVPIATPVTTPVATQLGTQQLATPPGEGRGGTAYTCVNPAPSRVVDLLELLDSRPGLRVLEVGTGSGWITALLCRLTGDSGSVTSVESDAVVASAAGRNLAAAGVRPYLVMGDLARGCPERAPYDRVLAPFTVPDSWLAQTRPGAVIVGGDDLSRLAVTAGRGDGRSL
ncbi:hypothetical protein GCM10022224_085130 [Nonomuraea antimicrobica]|uniref:Protein-L-isoaspartate O-methyltransferase n=1 Tax=Nonomuraea antimicrobica TaxID=561173 RepID=A0ABP7DMM5_9ACTN